MNYPKVVKSNSEVANILVWTDSDGMVTKTVDITENLGFGSYYNIIYTQAGILAYTNTALIDFEENKKYRSFAVFLDLQGNVLWEKEIFENREKDFTTKAAELADNLGFVFMVKEWFNDESLTFYQVNLQGEFKELGKVKSIIDYHELRPLKIFSTQENDLLVWQAVRLDSIINGENANDKYGRQYMFKINKEDLNLLSSNDKLYSLDKRVQLFPNPANQILNITFTEEVSTKPKTVKLINYLGQVSLLFPFRYKTGLLNCMNSLNSRDDIFHLGGI